MKRVLLVTLASLAAGLYVAHVALAKDPPQDPAADEQQQQQQQQPTKLSTADKHFMNEAAQSGMAEVALGQLAIDKSQNAEVKKFAQGMVDDHTKMNEDLKTLATQKGVTLPIAMTSEDRKTESRLGKLTAAKFDNEYMKQMVLDHKKDVTAFEQAAKTAKDPDVRAFASQNLPTLQKHLEQAKATEKMAVR
jgi:putative membrane protein